MWIACKDKIVQVKLDTIPVTPCGYSDCKFPSCDCEDEDMFEDISRETMQVAPPSQEK